MSEESYGAFVSNYNHEIEIDKLKTRIRELELAARLKEVEHKAAIVKEYQRGIECAREAVGRAKMVTRNGDAFLAEKGASLAAIGALTEARAEMEGGE